MGTIANIGYFFQRGYYDGLTLEDFTDSSSEKKLQKKYFNTQNEILKNSSRVKVPEPEQIYKDNCTCTIPLTTIYPGLITGIGMIHASGMQGEAKLGMAFDYTSGLPYIPGSSVKGLLRSMFPILPNNKPVEKRSKEEKEYMSNRCQYIKEECRKNELPVLKDSDVEKLAQIIFEGRSFGDKNDFLSIYDRDIFFDAYIGEGDYREKGILDFDYITPHRNPLKNPEPNMFLKILPKVTFDFTFRLRDSKLESGCFKADDKKILFQAILTTVGIGAKTNVGYGQLK